MGVPEANGVAYVPPGMRVSAIRLAAAICN